MQFDAATQQYLDNQGNTVPDSVIRTLVERVQQQASDRILALYERYRDGDIDAITLKIDLQLVVKEAHGHTFLIGSGGRNNVDSGDWAALGREMRFQYGRVRSLMVAITGETASEAQIENRLRMFANSAKGSYELGRKRSHRKAGYQYEKRIRTKTESCQSCLLYASRGWVTIGTLPEPTKRCECRVNCGCYKKYSRRLPTNDSIHNRHPLSNWGDSERLARSLW